MGVVDHDDWIKVCRILKITSKEWESCVQRCEAEARITSVGGEANVARTFCVSNPVCACVCVFVRQFSYYRVAPALNLQQL